MSDESGSNSDISMHSIGDGNSNVDSSSTSTCSEHNIIDEIIKMMQSDGIPEGFAKLPIHEKLAETERMLTMHEALLRIEPLRIPKSNDESHKHEESGDNEFDNTNYEEALCHYNESIAFAENDYQHLYRLYEKRAYVLNEVKLFKPCLHSFELAIKYCPSDLVEAYKSLEDEFIRNNNEFKSKEENIRSECQTDIDSLTKLKNDRIHPNVPFIDYSLELNYNEDYGRGITTKFDLNPGDVAAIDKAYALILYSSLQYRHCSNCLKENWSLIPCPHCTTAMYCNQKCLQIAWKKFHKHECEISNYLSEIFPKVDLMWFRVPLQTIELFGGIDPLIEFEETYQHVDIDSLNVFNVDHRDIQYDDDGEIVNYTDNVNFNSRMTVSNYYPIHGLIRDLPESSHLSTDTYLCGALATLLIYRLFRDIYNITTDNQKRFVETFIYRHVRAAGTYNYELNITKEENVEVPYGSALFPFGSLINHSCAPNLVLVHDGSSLTITVLHPIKAGDQLFFYYGPHYEGDTVSERRTCLESKWNFICQCIACTEDYPQMANLPTYCIPYEPFEDCYAPYADLELKDLIELIKALFAYRRSHLQMFPCKDICYYEGDVTNYLCQLSRRLFSSVCMNC